jgi:hypothetical protein
LSFIISLGWEAVSQLDRERVIDPGESGDAVSKPVRVG